MLRRGSLVALCAALLSGSFAAANKSSNPSGCDGLRLLFKASPEAPTPGKSLKVAYTLSNKSGQYVKSSNVAITLPADVTYTSSNAKPMGSAGTLSGSDVTWASAGAVNAGKSKTYTAAMTVGAGAQLLTFDAAASVVLSDGTTCTVEAPASIVRAKGYKHAVATPPATTKAEGAYPVGLRLDADTPGADGYVEQVLISREGIEMVFACFLGGKAPQALDDSTGAYLMNDVNYAFFVRPSELSSPGVAPINSWWGYCGNTGGGPGISPEFQPNESGGTTKVLPEVWCVGDVAGDTTGTVYEDYFDNTLQLMNMYGGRLAVGGFKSGTVGFNWQVGDQHVCYVGMDITYRESGSTFPF